jgi:DeoR/GlpR family transcriptional regulator of sugar metabolism
MHDATSTSECYACGRIYLALLKKGASASIQDLVLLTAYSRRTVRLHLRNLFAEDYIRGVEGEKWMVKDTLTGTDSRSGVGFGLA